MGSLSTRIAYIGFCSGALQTQRLKTHPLRTQSSKVLPKAWSRSDVAMLVASPTARDSSLN